MDEVLGAIAEELDIPPVNAGLAIDGAKIKVIEGQKGTVVDQDSLRESLKAVLFTLHSTELEIPMTVKEPEVQADDTQAAREAAETMVSASVKLTSGEKTWTLSPEDIALYMDFTSEDQGGVSTLVPYLSAEKMAPFFADIADGVATEPISATFDSDGSKAWVVPGVVGKKLDAENTAVALTAAALEATGRKAEAAVTTAEPELTTEEAKAMGIADKLSGFTTEPYAGTSDRQHNVRLTTKLASDVFLAPGEVYNFLELVGPRTAERGFKQAKGIVGQGVLEDVLGGGICQVSTTIFNAAFFAGLEIVERWNHSLYISHYPKGRDATATGTPEDGKNLRFRNDTDHYIWVRGVSDGVTTTFNIYGTSDGRKVSHTTSDFYDNVAQTQTSVTNTSLGPGTTVIQSSGQPGRTCTVKRTVTWPDGTSKTDKFVSRFPMYPKVIEVGSGDHNHQHDDPGLEHEHDGLHRILGCLGALGAASDLVVRSPRARPAQGLTVLDHLARVLHLLAAALAGHRVRRATRFVFLGDSHLHRSAGEELFVGPVLPQFQRIGVPPGVRHLRPGSHSNGTLGGQIDEGSRHLAVVDPLETPPPEGHSSDHAHGVAGAAIHLDVDQQVTVRLGVVDPQFATAVTRHAHSHNHPMA